MPVAALSLFLVIAILMAIAYGLMLSPPQKLVERFTGAKSAQPAEDIDWEHRREAAGRARQVLAGEVAASAFLTEFAASRDKAVVAVYDELRRGTDPRRLEPLITSLEVG